MHCRSFLFALLLGAVSAAEVLGAAPKQPNILFCFADDWGRYAGAYADVDGRPSPSQVVKTPNIDRVAREGVLFKNAFVTAPSCTPCRSSILSGQYFFRTGRGAILQGAEWDAKIPSFPPLLEQAGYHLGETYKVWSPGTPNDAPYGAGKFGYEKAGRAFNTFSQRVTKMVADGVPLEEAKQKLYGEVSGNFDAFLKARKDGQPFCYWFGPTNVHRLWVKGSGKALWDIDPEALAGKLPKFLPDVPEVRQDFADYLGEVQAFDAAVGVLLEQLKAAGELDNTLIVISGDHGASRFSRRQVQSVRFRRRRRAGGQMARRQAGTRGRRLRQLDGPGADISRSRRSGTAQGDDGPQPGRRAEVGAFGTGRSEAHLGSDRARAPRRRAREDNLPYPQRALRTKDFLYIRNFKPDRWPLGAPYAVTETDTPEMDVLENNTFAAFPDMDASPTKAWLIAHRHDPQWKWQYDYAFGKRPGEELYDLRKDPDEANNVADDAAYADAKHELSAQLLKILTDAADPRVTGDKQTFERPPFTDPQPRRPAKRKPRAAK